MTITVSLDEFTSSAGRDLEPSDWLLIDQQRVDRFAQASSDFQFIHVDPGKAAQTPFKGTIAHGFLTLSLLPYLNNQKLIVPEHLAMAINYGSDKVRFFQAVSVGDRIRSQQKILDVASKKTKQWILRRSVKVEIENRGKPALLAEILSMYIVE